VVVGGNKLPVVRKQDNYTSQRIAYGKQLNNNLATGFSLNLRIPIFNAHQVKNRIKLAQLDLKNAELVAASTKTSLQQFVEQAFANMNSAWERYRILVQQVNDLAEAFRGAEARFNGGVGNSIDYLISKNNLERSRTNLIAARYEYLLRTKVLDYYQGKLNM
jgi:outer membrane protein